MDSLTSALVAEVQIPRPIDKPLHYGIPVELNQKVQLGSVVKVPFRSKEIYGFVTKIISLAQAQENAKYELKNIIELVLDEPCFNQKDLDLYQWVADYYQMPLGEVFYSAFPQAILKKVKPSTKKNIEQVTPPAPVTLTSDQSLALSKIVEAINEKKYKSFLLFGVTGSGKTEVYIQAAQKIINQNQSVLILVPEIALTPQLRTRFEERFQDQVAVMHSSLSVKQRKEFWHDILNEKRKVIVGARSAFFAPIKNLGLVVVDEEHEPSYKQEDRLRYNARDLSLVRAKQHNAVVVLGSATPAIETFYATQSGKHELLELKSRPQSRALPKIEIIDLKENSEKNKNLLLTRQLRDALTQTLLKNEQAILFVNRKGFSNFLLCEDCGEVAKCLNCSVSLTYYKSSNEYKCHYCFYKEPFIKECKKCKSKAVKLMGMGTEQVEEELKLFFPSIVIDRIDADSTDSLKSLEEKLANFKEKKTQVLIGTQMLAKGHDFPNVTLVGVVAADQSLNIPDFRSAERAFQLLTQVAGRAGRGDQNGLVLIQTYLPQHYVIQAVINHNYLEFYNAEIELRKIFQYPPFSKMAQIELRNLNDNVAENDAFRVKKILDQLKRQSANFDYLGPARASIAKISNKYRWHLLLKSEKSSALNAVLKTIRKEGIRLIDVDPLSTL